jgi:hypothetical protein
MLAFERGDGGVVASLCDAQVETEEEGREGEVWKLMGGGAGAVAVFSFWFSFERVVCVRLVFGQVTNNNKNQEDKPEYVIQ